jgi:hypothetical protein
MTQGAHNEQPFAMFDSEFASLTVAQSGSLKLYDTVTDTS